MAGHEDGESKLLRNIDACVFQLDSVMPHKPSLLIQIWYSHMLALLPIHFSSDVRERSLIVCHRL